MPDISTHALFLRDTTVTNRPLFSVIVPTYRRNRVLCRTLDLIRRNRFRDCEILLIDQTDLTDHDEDTQAYLADAAAEVRRVFHTPPNLPAARNRGVHESRGEIIVFFDDDMELPDNLLATLAERYRDPNVAILTGVMLSANPADDDFVRSTYRRRARHGSGLGRVSFNQFNGGFMSFRRSVYERVGGFDEWLGAQPLGANEDMDFARRVQNSGCDLLVDQALEVRHLEADEGGVGRASMNVEARKEAQAFAGVYVVMKSRRWPGILGFVGSLWESYRMIVLNRASIVSPLRLPQRHLQWAALVARSTYVLAKH